MSKLLHWFLSELEVKTYLPTENLLWTTYYCLRLLSSKAFWTVLYSFANFQYIGLSRSEIMNSSPIKIRNPDLFYGSGFQTEISPDINIPEKIRKSGYYNRPIRNDFFLRNGRAVQKIVGKKHVIEQYDQLRSLSFLLHH